MNEFISGKEVLLALASGEEVQSRVNNHSNWHTRVKFWTVNDILSYNGEFRLKPRTITINGIEVPKPFEPKEGEWFYFIEAASENGYSSRKLHDDTPKYLTLLGAWRTEAEINQVVAALRKVLKGE